MGVLNENLKKQVKDLSQYLDNHAIAQALKLTPEIVQDILDDKAQIEINPNEQNQNTIININSVKTAYRQKVISLYSTKGGVGTTSIAIGLAYWLSKEIKVLLVDLNHEKGGNDLSFYLSLPELPTWERYKDNLRDCIIPYEETLHIIQSPKYEVDKEMPLEAIILEARQDYDVIIFDLPKIETENSKIALKYSNLILIALNGQIGEMSRIHANLKKFSHKDTAFVLNKNKQAMHIVKTIFSSDKIWAIENDKTLAGIMEEGEPPKEKGLFMKGIKTISTEIFESDKKGFLGMFKK